MSDETIAITVCSSPTKSLHIEARRDVSGIACVWLVLRNARRSDQAIRLTSVSIADLVRALRGASAIADFETCLRDGATKTKRTAARAAKSGKVEHGDATIYQSMRDVRRTLRAGL
ncbi:MAG: hypothetical protein ACHREM_15460 [Polyangiales bacterium]